MGKQKYHWTARPIIPAFEGINEGSVCATLQIQILLSAHYCKNWPTFRLEWKWCSLWLLVQATFPFPSQYCILSTPDCRYNCHISCCLFETCCKTNCLL